jgi:hypothetical protein
MLPNPLFSFNDTILWPCLPSVQATIPSMCRLYTPRVGDFRHKIDLKALAESAVARSNLFSAFLFFYSSILWRVQRLRRYSCHCPLANLLTRMVCHYSCKTSVARTSAAYKKALRGVLTFNPSNIFTRVWLSDYFLTLILWLWQLRPNAIVSLTSTTTNSW